MQRTNKLDKLDLAILSQLQLNARITNQDLAKHVSLSPSACLARVRRLEDAGLVKRYIADIDIGAIQPTMTVFTAIKLENHTPDDFDRFDAAIEKLPEVVECHQVSGDHDYLLKVVCADMDAYRNFSDDLLRRQIGVASTTSIFTMKISKPFSGFKLPTNV